MNIPHGTAAILEFAETLPESAKAVKEVRELSKAAEKLLISRILLERLAPLESDIDATLGEG